MSKIHAGIKLELKTIFANIEYMETGLQEQWPGAEEMRPEVVQLRTAALDLLRQLLEYISAKLAPGADELLDHILDSPAEEQVVMLDRIFAAGVGEPNHEE